MELFKHFCIPMIHTPEATELPLCPVPVAMMIAVLSGEFAARKGINDLDPCNDLHGKWQRCFPAGRELLLVLEVKLGRWSVCHTGHSTHLVVHLIQQVGLDAARKIEKEHIGT